MTVYTFINEPQDCPDDTRALIAQLSEVDDSFFSDNVDLVLTRAPGRLDVMGGIADYSGSLVLQLPIADATHVILEQTAYPNLLIKSTGTSNETESRSFEMDLAEFQDAHGQPIEYSTAKQFFELRNAHWASYIAGAFLVLMREQGHRFNQGARILIASTVPEGKGVSSSAALEVAVMNAIIRVFDIHLSPSAIALLCQKLENLVAGAPCGIMDQMTSSCGDKNRLLELLCQPSQFIGTLALPAELEMWGVDSGVRHSVGGSDYTTVRTAAFMGYRMIADIANLTVTPKREGKVEITDPLWHGYLANIQPQEFEEKYADRLPASSTGAAFLQRYQGISDDVTRVDERVDYPIKAATAHPIYENHRVQEFASILKTWRGLDQATRLGELMFESHQSYSNCGLGSPRTDLIVDLIRDDSEGALFGGRITGGGSGGTVAILGKRGATRSLDNLVRKFEQLTEYRPVVMSGSSTGAHGFDHLRLRKITPAREHNRYTHQ